MKDEILELFKGIVVIIDDKINDTSSKIFEIKQEIEKKDISVVCYDNIPAIEKISSFSNASFIILDWSFSDLDGNGDLDERISMGATNKKEEEERIIKLIKRINNDFFIPLFIFSDETEENIKEKISEREVLERIFVRQKSSFLKENLFKEIEKWVKENPSVYVLKKVENNLFETKHKIFIEMNKNSSEWVKIVWDLLKKDSSNDFNQEFGNFLTRSIFNRLKNYEFNEDYMNKLGKEEEKKKEELIKIIQSERFITNNKNDYKQAYTGDLYKKNENYYLNIRAQCDISREHNPSLYLIKGKKIEGKEIKKDLKIKDKKLCFSNEEKYDIKTIDDEEIKKINEKLTKHKNGIFMHYGEFLEKKTEAFISCVAGEIAIKFDLKSLQIEKFDEWKDKYIGRILPPYITRIQQKFGQFIVREGILPVPEDIF